MRSKPTEETCALIFVTQKQQSKTKFIVFSVGWLIVLSVNSRRQKVHSFFSWVIWLCFQRFPGDKKVHRFFIWVICALSDFQGEKVHRFFQSLFSWVNVLSVGRFCGLQLGCFCGFLLVASSSWWTLTPSFLLSYVIVWCWVSLEISSMYFHAHEKINSLKNFFGFHHLSPSQLYVCVHVLEIWFKVLKLFQLLPALLQAISFFLLGLSQASWVSQIFKGQRVCVGEGARRSKRICGVSCALWKTKDIEFGRERERNRAGKLKDFCFSSW